MTIHQPEGIQRGGVSALEVECQGQRVDIARREQPFGARSEVLGLLNVIAGGKIAAIALPLIRDVTGDIGRQSIAEPPCEIRGGFDGVVVSVRQRRAGAERVARRLGRDADAPAGRVSTEQRALGPFVHLDLLNVVQLQETTAQTCDVDPVDIRRNGVLFTSLDGRGTDAAQVSLETIHAALHGQPRNRRSDVLGILDTACRKIAFTYRGNGDRNVLDVFAALVGGHHDLLEPAFVLAFWITYGCGLPAGRPLRYLGHRPGTDNEREKAGLAQVPPDPPVATMRATVLLKLRAQVPNIITRLDRHPTPPQVTSML